MKGSNKSEQKVIETLTNRLEADPEVQFALLFGSYARGLAKESSDIDVAVCGNHPISSDCLADLNIELSDLLGIEVDIVDLNARHGSSLSEPMLKGKILVLKNPAIREALLGRMMREYEDDGRMQDTIFKERMRIWIK
jgi:uncharacterized protein